MYGGDWKGIVHYELLPLGQTINSILYCEQLERLRQAMERKRPELINRKGVVFHHDNARPHTSLMTRQKLRELGWEVLMGSPYSPDITPTDYHLFRSLQNPFVELSWLQERPVKTTWFSFPTRNHRSSVLIESWLYPKNGEKLSIIMESIWFK